MKKTIYITSFLFSILSILLFVFNGCDDEPFCLAEGTSVLTPTGDILIENLKVGDIVYSFDLVNNTLKPSHVIAVRKNRRACYQFKISENQFLEATLTHPIYSPQTERYEVAEKWFHKELHNFAILNTDQEFLSSPSVTMQSVGKKTVYDITVDSPQANFIANGILVHNKPPVYEGTPPVTDLEVVSKSDTSLTLSWTVPGNSSIYSDVYDMRFSDSDLNYINWLTLDSVSNLPAPGAFGTKDTVEIMGLSSQTIYWINMITISNKLFRSDYGNEVADSTL